MIKTVLIDAGNSPKFYLNLTDIYGAPLSLNDEDFLALEYTVYKVTGTSRTPLPNFTNVAIDRARNWSSTPQAYPAGIVGLTAEEAARKYNLTLFPYVASTADGVTSWTSPFTEAGAIYDVDLLVSYHMIDPSLPGSARLARVETIRVITKAQ